MHALQRLQSQGCHTPRQPGPPPFPPLPSGKGAPRLNVYRGCASTSQTPTRRAQRPPRVGPGAARRPRRGGCGGGRAAVAASGACAVPGTRPFTHRWNREAPFPGLGRFSRTLGDVDKARTEARSDTAAGGSPSEAASGARLKRRLWRRASPVATPGDPGQRRRQTRRRGRERQRRW